MRRRRLVDAWTVLPNFVSANLSEPGAADLCAVLVRRGIGIEAGVWTVDDARALVALGLASQCLRLLVEAQPRDPGEAVAAAAAIDAVLDGAAITLPRVDYGDGLATWAVLDAALDRAHDVRIGLEDTL